MPILSDAPHADSVDLTTKVLLGTEPATHATLAELLALAGAVTSAAPVNLIGDAVVDLDPTHVGQYNRLTNAAAVTINVQTEAVEPMPENCEIQIRVAGAGGATVVAAGGVTVSPPAGGTLQIPTGGTAALKRIAADSWDLIGQTVPAP